MNAFGVTALVFSVVGIVSAGNVWILKTPPGFEIDSRVPMKQNDVSSLLFRAFGIGETADCSWPGLVQRNPFATSRRAIVVAIPSSTADKEQADFVGKRVPLASGFNPDALVYTLDQPLISVYGHKAGVEIVEQASVPVTKGIKIPPNSLNASLAPVSHFVDELSALAALPSVVFNSNAPAKAYVFQFDSLDDLGKREDIAEGRRLIAAVLRDLVEDADATILAVSYSSAGKARNTREAGTGGASKEDPYDYVVPFNLILWLSLALFFITMAVSIGIGSMDPGWDSIIYRMTNQRVKKDN